MVSRISALFACLLALVVASPLCCCAGQAIKDREPSSCCCGDAGGDDEPCHRCPCASDDPREIPDPLVLPQGAGAIFGCPPPAAGVETGHLPAPGYERPRWTPSPPWHAPPAERRARLVSRLL